MKKIFALLILTLTTSLLSCSNDDDKKSSITTNINGTSKSFKNVSVTEQVFTDYSDFFALTSLFIAMP